jgi:hypothetical protein
MRYQVEPDTVFPTHVTRHLAPVTVAVVVMVVPAAIVVFLVAVDEAAVRALTPSHSAARVLEMTVIGTLGTGAAAVATAVKVSAMTARTMPIGSRSGPSDALWAPLCGASNAHASSGPELGTDARGSSARWSDRGDVRTSVTDMGEAGRSCRAPRARSSRCGAHRKLALRGVGNGRRPEATAGGSMRGGD